MKKVEATSLAILQMLLEDNDARKLFNADGELENLRSLPGKQNPGKNKKGDSLVPKRGGAKGRNNNAA